MTEDDTAIDLREGLAQVSDRARPGPDAPSPDELWAAAHGEYDARRALQVVDRALADPVAWEEWRLMQAFEQALAVQTEGGEEHAANDDPSDASGDDQGRWRERGWITVGVGLAAALVAVISMKAATEVRPVVVDDAAIYRDEAREGPRSLLGPDPTLPREAFELRWEPGPEGVRYELQVSTEQPRLLLHRRGLTEARLVVPAEVLAPVPAGAPVLWRVEEIHDDGRRRSATFMARVR